MTPSKARLVHLLGLPGHKISYEQARDLLDHPDIEVRKALAARDDLEPEILFFLARDPDTSVRRLIATNTVTPGKASVLLASDDDADVRCDLAERLGRILPELAKDQANKASRTVHQVLSLLARDQLPRVRRALSEALKCLPEAPHDIISKLARDPEVSVAAPVLQFSPVLTDEDLIEIIQSSPLTVALVAISRRVNVGEDVSNAIVGTGDTDAIAALLRNQSAQIREATLDAIVDAAPIYKSWHDPLAHRRHLPGRAALRIAEFVADSLLQAMAARQDFDPATTAALGHMVRQKLKRDDGASAAVPDPLAQALDAEALRRAEKHAADLAAAGKLTTAAVMKVAHEGLSTLAVAALAVKSNMPVQAVADVIRSSSAKGMLAIAWAGDFTATEAEALQLKIARVTPEHVIKPRAGGWFDATEAELEWQLSMFRDGARISAAG